jgi:hypothetical protein
MAQRNELLTDLGRVTQGLREWLEENPQIDIIDQLYIENHIALVRMSYSAWKSKQPENKHGRHAL